MLSEPYFSANFSKIFSPPPSPRHPRQRYPAAILPTSSRSTNKHGSAKIAGVVRCGTLEVGKTKMKTIPWWAMFLEVCMVVFMGVLAVLGHVPTKDVWN